MTLNQFPEGLIQLFKLRFQLCDSDLELVAQRFYPLQLSKRDFYLQQGKVSRSKAFLVKGSVRYFFVDNNLKENTLFFRFEGSWLGDIESYHEEKPSRINIQTLENSDLLVISKSDFSELQQQIPVLEKWYAINAVKMYAALFNKLVEAKLRTPEEKYLYLMDHEPQLLQRVSLQHIAAYLEIEPQSLSRIRKRLMKPKS